MYVFPKLSTGELAELQATLCEYCNKIPSTSDFRPAVGDVCCAKFTGKGGRKECFSEAVNSPLF